MTVIDALTQRKSTRAFLDKEVPIESLRKILDAARHTPSGTNIQPWQVAVITGSKKDELCALLEQEFRAGTKEYMDYTYYPGEWTPPYKERRKACGLQMYSALNITRQDKQRQIDQWATNFRAFDAPVMLLFFMDPVMETGSFIDYGMFMQSIMLTAVEEGLATCPQGALAIYPDISKKALDYPQDSILLGGMALGYEDTQAVINSYRTHRVEVDEFTKFFS